MAESADPNLLPLLRVHPAPILARLPPERSRAFDCEAGDMISEQPSDGMEERDRTDFLISAGL